jgi:penicillin-binding protein 2
MGLGAHGSLKLKRALETSCNIYFHELGCMIGIDNLEKWAKYFGLGEYTGIDIPGEYKGVRAGQESKTRIYNDIWRPADTAQTAIGQFNNAFTPVQMVRYIGALANGGKLYRPHVIKSIVKYDGSIVNETIPEYNVIPVSEYNMQAVREGMISVVHSEEGTASSVFGDFPMEVAGKTGTAETGQEVDESSNALFACYAPADAPEIAIVVVIEKGVWGSYTAPVAKAIIEEYFLLKNSNGSDSDSALYEAVFTR